MLLPNVQFPPPNLCVRARMARSALREPDTVRGRPLYLQRLGVVVLPHVRRPDDRHGGWICTVVGGSLDVRSVVGAFWIGDVEIQNALEVRDVLHPLADLSPEQFCAAWLTRVWDRWPGGRPLQTAQALLEFVEPASLTVITAPARQPRLVRRTGLGCSRGVDRQCAALAVEGLLVPRFTDPLDEMRSYQLQLPPAVVPV